MLCLPLFIVVFSAHITLTAQRDPSVHEKFWNDEIQKKDNNNEIAPHQSNTYIHIVFDFVVVTGTCYVL